MEYQSINRTGKHLQTCYKVYKMYSNILNSYVSDYYIENHWEKLSTSWKNYFENIKINELCNIMDFSKPLENKLYPLSLLCLRSIIVSYSLSRQMVNPPDVTFSFENNSKFMNFFWKNVKLKKRHEIDIMAKLCYKMAQETNCFYIVDIGSGLGHLSRMISYGYGLKVCTFEAVEALANLAEEMDNNFEKTLNKRNIKHLNTFKTVHINKKINTELNVKDFVKLVETAFNTSNIQFGIVGLHPCGDLGATLLRLYTESSNVVFINIASCCYMKLSINPAEKNCFPLSNYCKVRSIHLSYLDCEIACHAIENYVIKLDNSIEFEKLKIHAYRAALEQILVSVDPRLKHMFIGNAKCDKSLTFSKYVEKICDNGNFPELPRDTIILYEDIICKSWRKVVVFHSVRLLLAPLIENIILLDRLLYVLENGGSCKIHPIFNCNISPRNQVLSASKINT